MAGPASSSYGRVKEVRLLTSTNISSDSAGRVSGGTRHSNQARVAWFSGQESFYTADVAVSPGDVLVTIGSKTRVHREVNATTGQSWVWSPVMPGWMALLIIPGIVMVPGAFLLGDSPDLRLIVFSLGVLFLAGPFLGHHQSKQARARRTLTEYERLKSTPEFQAFLRAD